MSNLKSKIESLLFISAKPMSIKQLSGLIKKDAKEIKAAGNELVNQYKEEGRGAQIIKSGSKFQMVSSADNTKLVQDFIKDETTGELSRPSLEALTIVAYRGPIAKMDLDRIRGVNCSLILRNLLIRGLIESKYHKDKDATYYNITMDFLRFLGLNDVKELPNFEKLSKDDTIDRILGDESGEENTAESMGNASEDDADADTEKPKEESVKKEEDVVNSDKNKESVDEDVDEEEEEHEDDDSDDVD